MEFNKVAKEWDTPQRIERAKVIAEEIKTNLLDVESKKVLEFGCGTGLISFNLYDFFKDIILIDNSEEMIKVVNNKIKLLKASNIKGSCCNILEIDEKEKYDGIYSSMALHHIVDIDGLLNKFYRILNNRGKFCIVDLNEDNGAFHKDEEGFNGHNGFSQEYLENILRRCGFDNINVYTFYHGIKEISGKYIKYSLFIISGEKL